MRILMFLTAFFAWAFAAQAQSDFTLGLKEVRAELDAKTDLTDDERFTLAGVIVLQTLEKAFQTRWEYGVGRSSGLLPVLRVPLPENPNPKPFDAAVIETIFEDVLSGMEEARTHLAMIPVGSDFGAEVDFADIWFDINGDGVADAQESVFGVARTAMGVRQIPESAVARFDRADVDWLVAYTHVFSGFAELILAFEPVPILERLLEAEEEIAALHGDGIDYIGAFMMDSEWLSVATIVMAIEQRPDAARTEAARQHFLAMVQANQRLWKAVALETDNDREWIPNDKQTHALGLQFPPNVGATWISVLMDFEAVLKGEKLMPYWRGGQTVGLNVKRIFMDPPEINLIGWIHGIDAIPYLERGEVANGASWNQFQRLVGRRNALFFAATLN